MSQHERMKSRTLPTPEHNYRMSCYEFWSHPPRYPVYVWMLDYTSFTVVCAVLERSVEILLYKAFRLVFCGCLYIAEDAGNMEMAEG